MTLEQTKDVEGLPSLQNSSEGRPQLLKAFWEWRSQGWEVLLKKSCGKDPSPVPLGPAKSCDQTGNKILDMKGITSQ